VITYVLKSTMFQQDITGLVLTTMLRSLL